MFSLQPVSRDAVASSGAMKTYVGLDDIRNLDHCRGVSKGCKDQSMAPSNLRIDKNNSFY